MKRVHIFGIAYLGAALVFSIAIDVSAKIQRSSSSDSFSDSFSYEAEPAEEVEAAEDVEMASKKSCGELFVMQKEFATEMALAFQPKAKKKARKKIAADINKKMAGLKDKIIAKCMETLPQSEVDCVLDDDNEGDWNACGPNITAFNKKDAPN